MYMLMREYIQRIRHARAHARVYTGIAAACSDCSACSDQPATTAASCAPERELPRINTEVRYGGIPVAYRNKPRPAHRMKSSSREYIHGGITQNMGCVAYTT